MVHSEVGEIIVNICRAAASAAPGLALATAQRKNAALLAGAHALENALETILAANKQDLNGLGPDVSAPYRDRLTLNEARVKAMANGLRAIAALPDPVGRVLASWQAPGGFMIERVAVPLGVIGVIFESRPNVAADAGALCLKAGSPVVLRCGSDSLQSCKAIVACLQEGLAASGIDKNALQLVPLKEREAVDELLKQVDYIDVIIPRGGKSLVQKVAASPIPTFKHLSGVCHTYVHERADVAMAQKVLVNAKMRRTSICGATETLLVDKAFGDDNIKALVGALAAAGCRVRADEYLLGLMPSLEAATEDDWGAEYLDAVISARVVNGVEEAAAHIKKYGSAHTDAIITSAAAAAEQFLNLVDSAIVMHNASTQFADGGEFGMGAEIGIATGRLHARGPVGLEQLCTFKYKVRGDGQIRKV